MRKPNRAAAPIIPEMAPDAPISGAWSSMCSDIVQGDRRQRGQRPEPGNASAPRRLASGEPNAASQIMLIARCGKRAVQEGDR